MSAAHIWLVMLLAPLLSTVALMQRDASRPVWFAAAILSVTPALICAVVAPPSFLPNGLWPDAQLGITQTGRGWLAFTAFLWGAAAVYALQTLSPQHPNGRRFWLFWMASCSGNLLLIISLDAISFYVGFSMMSLAAYVLVVHEGTPSARRAG